VPIIGLINKENPSGIKSAADFNGTEQRELQPYQDFLFDMFKDIE
jgi:hypothetical protein